MSCDVKPSNGVVYPADWWAAGRIIAGLKNTSPFDKAQGSRGLYIHHVIPLFTQATVTTN